MSKSNFFEDMPVQKVNNFLVIICSGHGIGAISDKKGQKIKKNVQILTNKAQK